MILVNGVFHEGTKAEFDYTDRGLTLADGLFETMPVLDGAVFLKDAHLDRMEQGLDLLGFSVARSRLEADLSAMIARTPDGRGVLRLTVTRGSGARGLSPPVGPKPTVIVSLAPFNSGLVMEAVTLATVSVRRNEHSPLSRIKSLGYLDNVIALREAGNHGARDALMLNTAGNVACASVANVFALFGRTLITPPVEDGVLDGICRRLILDHAADMGLTGAERSLTREDLRHADAIFLTNSVRFAQPVTRLDSHSYDFDLAALIGRSRRLQAVLDLYAAPT